MRARLIPWGISFEGDTWGAVLRVCRTLDGRWTQGGVALNRFGWRVRPRYHWLHDRTVHRKMRLTQVWCPYLWLFVGENLVDTVYREEPREAPEPR